MQGEAERALSCRPPSLPNVDSIDSKIPNARPMPVEESQLLLDRHQAFFVAVGGRVECGPASSRRVSYPALTSCPLMTFRNASP